MSSLISNTELATFISGVRDHYDTFSQFHTLVVVKDPIKQITTITTDEYAGYGNESVPTNITLIPQSGVYRCMTYTPESWKDEGIYSIPISLNKGDMIIKVENDAKDYISNGINEVIILDNEAYIIAGGPVPNNYGSQWYYYYSLQKTT